MRAGRGEPLQCCGISRIVSSGLLDVGETGSGRDDRLIVFRQLVPFFQIDHEVIGGAALLSTRIIVVGRNLMEHRHTDRIVSSRIGVPPSDLG